MRPLLSIEDLEKKLIELILVDHVLLARAKDAAMRLVLDEGVTDGDVLVTRIVEILGAKHPGEFPMHSAIEFDWEKFKLYAAYFSAKLGSCEAIWQLISNGMLIPGDSGQVQLQRWTPFIATQVPRGYSGSTNRIEAKPLAATFLTAVLPAPSLRTNEYRSLTDGDLFLRDLGITGLHPLIEEALREAVSCFRHELYLPCLAMLTKAIEGAWFEMGAALADFGKRTGDSHGTALRKKLEDASTSLRVLIDDVADYYARPICKPVETRSAVKQWAIKHVLTWSHAVRDSRNLLHFDKDPSVPITYERVAVLMMATSGNLQVMHTVKDAADLLP